MKKIVEEKQQLRGRAQKVSLEESNQEINDSTQIK